VHVPEPDEWFRRVAIAPLMHQPGEGWMYDLGLETNEKVQADWPALFYVIATLGELSMVSAF
jgi:hypothetical protein